MTMNLERYKKDLDKLISNGNMLFNAIQFECYPEQFEEQAKKIFKDKFKENFPELKKNLLSFKDNYQSWYSESLAIIKFLLPDRVNDFTKLYEKPKNRKEITYGNYVIEDYLQGLTVTRGWEKEKVVGPEAAIPQFRQQLKILEAAQKDLKVLYLILSN